MSEDVNILAEIEAVLDQVRPRVHADGGRLDLVDFVDGVVKIRMAGACSGCPMSLMTLKAGVERALVEQVPEVRYVEQVP